MGFIIRVIILKGRYGKMEAMKNKVGTWKKRWLYMSYFGLCNEYKEIRSKCICTYDGWIIGDFIKTSYKHWNSARSVTNLLTHGYHNPGCDFHIDIW